MITRLRIGLLALACVSAGCASPTMECTSSGTQMVSEPYCSEREKPPRTGCKSTSYRMVNKEVCLKYEKTREQRLKEGAAQDERIRKIEQETKELLRSPVQ